MTPPVRIKRRTDEMALSEVIGFILLLGVIVAAFALWSVYIVPINGREAEITHMDAVKDRFTDYKFALDSLWINNQTDKRGVQVSTSFNLGTGGGNTQASGLFLPLLNPVASSATLVVKDRGDTITINTSDEGIYQNDMFDFPMNMTVLQYQSQNYYWIQQSYTYQLGGVFLEQADGATSRLSPDISVYNISNSPAVDITLIRLFGSGNVGGIGPVRVDSRLKSSNQINITKRNQVQVNWAKISVNTANTQTADAWEGVFNDTVARGYVTTGIVSRPSPLTVSLYVTGPSGGTLSDVNLIVRQADYDVWLNNIA